jgi:hypothetical protein
MFELISETSAIPRSLYITDVRTNPDPHAIAGDYKRVLKAKYQGKSVTLKVIEEAQKDVSIFSLVFAKVLIVWGEDQSQILSRSFRMVVALTPFYSPFTRHI